MTSPAPRRILVGLEDSATAGVVATAAAHLAMDQDATAVIVLHVIDTYTVAGGLLGLSGVTVPVIETGEDQEALQLNGTMGISPSRHIYAFLGSWRRPSVSTAYSADS